MMEIVYCTIKSVIVVLLLQFCFGDARDETLVVAAEGGTAELNINIPNNPLVNSARYISVRLDKLDGQTNDVLYLLGSTIKVRDEYAGLLTATMRGRKLKLRARKVSVVLAGAFRCFIHASRNELDLCGPLLIVVRKPDPPTIKVLPPYDTLRLVLQCEPHSRSQPRGMASTIWWYHKNGSLISRTGQRIFVSVQDYLIIDPLRKTDKGLQFYCVTADRTGDVTTEIKSNKSADFEIEKSIIFQYLVLAVSTHSVNV